MRLLAAMKRALKASTCYGALIQRELEKVLFPCPRCGDRLWYHSWPAIPYEDRCVCDCGYVATDLNNVVADSIDYGLARLTNAASAPIVAHSQDAI